MKPLASRKQEYIRRHAILNGLGRDEPHRREDYYYRLPQDTTLHDPRQSTYNPTPGLIVRELMGDRIIR